MPYQDQNNLPYDSRIRRATSDEEAHRQRMFGPPMPNNPYQLADLGDPNWSPAYGYPSTFYDQNEILLEKAGVPIESPVNIAKDPMIQVDPTYYKGYPKLLQNALLGK
jgi:hypothetical protein